MLSRVDLTGSIGLPFSMKARQCLTYGILLLSSVMAQAEAVKLSAVERAQGWRLLFDGESLGDWRGYRESKVPANWHHAANALKGDSGNSLVSEEEFGDFELTFDWKVQAGGHGEVYILVGEDGRTPAESGLVMQLSGHGAALCGTGGLVAPYRNILPQFDVWYQARILVYGQQIEYWLNGEKVVAFTLDTPDWRKLVAASPYHAFADFSKVRPGRIALSGVGVLFHDIRIRTL